MRQTGLEVVSRVIVIEAQLVKRFAAAECRVQSAERGVESVESRELRI